MDVWIYQSGDICSCPLTLSLCPCSQATWTQCLIKAPTQHIRWTFKVKHRCVFLAFALRCNVHPRCYPTCEAQPYPLGLISYHPQPQLSWKNRKISPPHSSYILLLECISSLITVGWCGCIMAPPPPPSHVSPTYSARALRDIFKQLLRYLPPPPLQEGWRAVSPSGSRLVRGDQGAAGSLGAPLP